MLRLILPAACLALLALPGCGDGRPKRVPVSGRVLIDDKPLTYGFIRLTPSGARPATATLDAEGRFTLTTFEPDDGVVLGTHPVSVLAAEPLSGSTQRWHAPKKYANPRTSGLSVTIDGPNDDLVIRLTWASGKPFVERVTAGE